MEKNRIRWGIIGTGKIARRFGEALNNVPEAELVAVGSRSKQTADSFADEYNVRKRHEGYEALVNDPEVDIVYIGTPHVFHLKDAGLAINAGKHVLCEKIMTLNAGEAEELINLARQKKRFLMEAMWTRFFPVHVRIREILNEGTLGKLLAVQANFFYCAPKDLDNRFYKKELGASVLLDAGSYGISFASSILGQPDNVAGIANYGQTDVDYQSAVLLGYKTGQMAVISASMISPDVKNARIVGEKGVIEIHPAWYKPTKMTLSVEGKKPETTEFPLGSYNGYEYEAMAVMDCVREGRVECDLMPLDETLSIIKTLDSVRSIINLKYPSE